MTETTSSYSPADLADFKAHIEPKLAQSNKELEYLKSLMDRKKNPSAFIMTPEDNEQLEGFTIDKLEEYINRQSEYSTSMKSALARIEKGTYGICLQTGELIDRARLLKIPHATYSLKGLEQVRQQADQSTKSNSSNTTKHPMNKFIISASALKGLLSKLSLAVPAKSVLPVLSNILCKVSSGKLQLIASDLEITIVLDTDVETTGEGFEFLMPLKLINQIVAVSKGVPLEFSSENEKIRIKGENDVYDLKSLEKVEDFPAIKDLPKKNSIEIDDSIISWLITAGQTVSKDEARPSLTKVLLELREKSLTIASSNGVSAVFNYSTEGSGTEKEDLLISPKALAAIAGIEKCKVSWHKTIYAFEAANITVIITRPDMNYVHFRALFPQDFDTNLSLDREVLIAALDKCSIADCPMKLVVITLGSKNIRFSSKNKALGINIDVDVPGNYSGNVKKTTVSAENLLRLLHQVPFSNIGLAIHDVQKPIVLRSEDDAAYWGLLMPMATTE